MSKTRSERPGLPQSIEERLLEGAWKESLSAVTLVYAHDLNNVLAGILGLTEVMLLESKPDDPAHESLTLMKRSARQAAELIEHLAALHRAKTGRREYHDLNALVTQSLDFLRRAVPKRIQFGSDLSTTPLPVLVDAVEFQQALFNLVLSATRATPKQGEVTVRTSRENKPPVLKNSAGTVPRLPAACLTVQDSGAGIPVDWMPTLFDAPTSAGAKGRAFGLGLLQVRRFTEHHRGVVVVDSNARTGTAIRVLLPMADFSESEGVPAG